MGLNPSGIPVISGLQIQCRRQTTADQVTRVGPVTTLGAVLGYSSILGHMSIWTREQHLTFIFLCALSLPSSQPGGQNP